MRVAAVGGVVLLGALVAACGPQVVLTTGNTTVQSQGGDASGASASNSATGGSAANEGSLSAGASGGNAQAGAGAAAAAGVNQSTTGSTGGAAGSPSGGASSAPGAGPSSAPAPTPTPVPTPTPSITPTQLIWHDDFELANADQVPGWSGFIGSIVSWRGLRTDPGQGLVALVMGQGDGKVPAQAGTSSATLRRDVDLSATTKPRLRLWTKAGGARADLVSLSFTLGAQSVKVPLGAAWAEQDLDLAAWAGNKGSLVLEARVENPSQGPIDGPAIDELRLYDAGKP